MTFRLLLAALALACLALPASARPRHQHAAPAVTCNGQGCSDWQPAAQARAHGPSRREARRIARGERIVRAMGFGRVIGGRPHGCPHAFCGCGASLHLFGRIIPALNLAANWLRFPRAAPAPDMAAARRGHVFVLKRHISGSVWLVFDANSGGGKTRIHPRSIAGFTVVNPRGAA